MIYPGQRRKRIQVGFLTFVWKKTQPYNIGAGCHNAVRLIVSLILERRVEKRPIYKYTVKIDIKHRIRPMNNWM